MAFPVQGLHAFASELKTELQKVNDNKVDLLRYNRQIAEENYQKDLEKVGEMYAARLRELETEKKMLEWERDTYHGMVYRTQMQMESSSALADGQIRQISSELQKSNENSKAFVFSQSSTI